jgi:hypothetical protein
MTLDSKGITSALESHALALGIFERVNKHEPKNAPGHGLTAAIWVETIEPVPEESGLASTTGRVPFMIRVYNNALAEPRDDIDPTVLGAVDALFTAYSGDFTLGGLIKDIDLLGRAGVPLSARAGYVTINQTMFRCMDITLPVVINDLWSQSG